MTKRRCKGEGTIIHRPDGRYMGQITIHGKKLTFYSKKQQEVKEWLDKVKYESKNGLLVKPQKITVSAWLDTWLNDYMKLHLRPSTFENYKLMVEVHIKPSIGHYLLQELRAEHLQKFYNKKLISGRKDGKQGGLSIRMVRYIHCLIHSALEQALKNNLVARNVSKATKLPGKVKHEFQPLTAEQIQKFLETAKNERLYTAFLLEFWTGLRRGELLGLRWKDIDFKKHIIHVKQSLTFAGSKLIFQQPKTAKSSRSIPIPESIIHELKAHKNRQNQERLLIGEGYKDNDLIFCQVDGRPLNPRNFIRTFKRILKKAGLPTEVRFHDCRHSFASMLLQLNEHPKVVQELLGHSTISTTLDIYSHVLPETKKAAINKLETLLKTVQAH